MLAVGADQRAKQHQFVRNLRALRHQLSQLKPWNGRANRRKGTSQLAGRMGLGIDQVHLRRATIEMNHDDRFA